MSNELQKHKTGDKIKWILTLIAFILIGVMFAGILCGWFDKKDEEKKEPETTQTAGEFSISDADTEIMTLTAIPLAAYSVTSSDDGYTSYAVEATITPSTALNKAVDWSVEWVEENSDNVTDYIKVVPEYDGALTATVTCIKAFSGEIAVVVTTRDGGYTADCVCTFVGKPTSLEVGCSQFTASGDTYALSVGTTYDFDIELDNIYHSVGSSYEDYNVTVVATGEMTVGTYESGSAGMGWLTSSLRSATLSEFTDNILSYSVEGNVLHVTLNKSIVGYYTSSKRETARLTTYTDKVYSIDSDCYFTFYVNSAKIGVSLQDMFKVVEDTASVTDVSVSTPALEF